MADLMGVLAEMREGQTAIDLNQKFNEVYNAVLANPGAGELTITLKMKPAEVAPGGKVLRVEIAHSIKIKVPETKHGPSMFFVAENGDLSRRNPLQESLFQESTRG